jgi:hypothetical protein
MVWQMITPAAEWVVLPLFGWEKLPADPKELLEGADSNLLLTTCLVTANALYSGDEGSSSSAGAGRP